MIRAGCYGDMENLLSVGRLHGGCWLDGLDRFMTPLTALTPTTSLIAAGFCHDSNSCGYLNVTPPDSEYSLDQWSSFRDWSRHWKRCSRCESPISPDEPTFTVMDALFHKSCMTCAVCNRRITTSDPFGVNGRRVYCATHFKAVEPVSRQFSGREAWNQSIEQTHKSWTEDTYPALSNLVREEKRKTRMSVRSATCSHSCPSKRVRTAFTSDQLNALNDFFESCRKPTNEQLEGLSGATGLKTNVLRVWFQNARAKLRRSFSDETKENVNALNVTR